MGNLLLSEKLPLRTTRMLGDYAEDQVLPHRLGDLRAAPFPLIRLANDEWFVADHPMTVTGVQIDKVPITGFDAPLRSDSQGNTWTVVRLAAPAPTDAAVSATGIGKLDPVTGNLIENPAELMQYVLKLAGRSEIFPRLRAEAAEAGLRLAGSLDSVQPIRAWLDEIAYSAGAIWTQQDARLYPTTVVKGPVTELDKLSALDIAVTSVLDDTADILRVSYDWNAAEGKPQHYVELSANPQRFGGVTAEIVLKWLRQPANAESVGRRILQRMAGIRYNVAHATNRVDLRPCAWTKLVAHPQWPIDGADPVLMVIAVDVTPFTKTAQVQSEVIASVPVITVTAHSDALPAEIGGGVSVAVLNGVATFTLVDNDARPIQDARVSLDGAPAKKTDALGRVSFEVVPSNPPKAHTLAMEAPGKTPVTMQVQL
jgi:hypothetical protein